MFMATAQRAHARNARRGVNGDASRFDGPHPGEPEGGNPGEGNDIEAVVRKVVSEVLSEVSDEVGTPEDEPAPGGGRPQSFASGRPGRPGGKPDGGEPVPEEVTEAIETLMQDLSPEQAQALASLFEAMGQGSDEGQEEPPDAGTGVRMSAQAARAEGARIAGFGAAYIVRMLLRMGLGPAARAAARRGKRAFRQWAKRVSGPVGWALRTAGEALITEIVGLLVGARGARRQAASQEPPEVPDEVDETEIEQVVRKVLAEALSEVPQRSSAVA
jgi:hypothetical protein